MNAEEAGNGLKTLLGKLGHPVLGPLITSWVVCNWKIFYNLLGGFRDPKATIIEIDTTYFNYSNRYELVIVPLAVTVLYLFVGPWLAHWYKRFLMKQENAAKKEELIILGEEPVRRSEYNSVERERIKAQTDKDVYGMELGVLKRMLVKETGGKVNAEQLHIPELSRNVTLDDLVKTYVEANKNIQIHYDEVALLKGQLLGCSEELSRLKGGTSNGKP